MPSTPAFGFRFPAPGDQPDVPVDIRNLAEDVEGQALTTNAAVTAAADSVAALDALGPKVIGTFEGGDGTNVTTIFDNIDQSYRHLQLIWRGTHNGTLNAVSLGMRFNGDNTSGNYAGFRGFAQPGGQAGVPTDGGSWSVGNLNTTTSIFCSMVGGHFGSHGVLWIPLYSDVSGVHTVHGTYLARGAAGVGDGSGLIWGMGGGTWTPSTNAAISSIQLWPVGQFWDGNVRATLIGYAG